MRHYAANEDAVYFMMFSCFLKIRNGLAFKAFDSRGSRIFIWFLFLLLGVLLGSVFDCPVFYENLSFHRVFYIDLLFFVLPLILSTSYLGCILIPLSFVLRGFLLFVGISSHSAVVLLDLFFAEVIPVMLTLPFYFLLADDCRIYSERLLELRFSVGRSIGRPQVLIHAALYLLFVFIDFIYCEYLLLQLVF